MNKSERTKDLNLAVENGVFTPKPVQQMFLIVDSH